MDNLLDPTVHKEGEDKADHVILTRDLDWQFQPEMVNHSSLK